MARLREIECATWTDVVAAVEGLTPPDAERNPVWFRGVREAHHQLAPSLMRETIGLTDEDHAAVEEDLFFEFQARAASLRERNLTDWECLFYGRHYGVPTRVMDWTDTFGIALYFALEDIERADATREPAIWVMDPTALNQETWSAADVILPRFLGLDDDEEFWDFGDLLASDGDWRWDGPVAIYPVQINERVRAQRGWFTIHGNDRRPLDEQYPGLLTRLRLRRTCVDEARRFLRLAGLNRFSVYPDLENLAAWIREKNQAWATARRAAAPRRSSRSRGR